jgi:hypothetical protein
MMLCVITVSHVIIHKHGGVIGADSSGLPGEGSLFYFELPVSFVRAEITEDPNDTFGEFRLTQITESSVQSLPRVQDQRILARRHRALVVDDSSLNRKMIKNIVKRCFADVLEVILSQHCVSVQF